MGRCAGVNSWVNGRLEEGIQDQLNNQLESWVCGEGRDVTSTVCKKSWRGPLCTTQSSGPRTAKTGWCTIKGPRQLNCKRQ